MIRTLALSLRNPVSEHLSHWRQRSQSIYEDNVGAYHSEPPLSPYKTILRAEDSLNW